MLIEMISIMTIKITAPVIINKQPSKNIDKESKLCYSKIIILKTY